jgi:signal transduction histidine kinase/DNA-binding response OmpR family regulator/HPt (histidine-containing phosphotransfer) domain-containing protein
MSLRTKAITMTVGITTMSLALVAATGVLQLRRQINTEQNRAADSMALAIARASELAMAVRDKHELARLCGSFLRDENILFIALYTDKGQLLTSSVRDIEAWEQFQHGRVDRARCAVGEHVIEPSAQGDEFTEESESDLDAPGAAPSEKVKVNLGRVVVSISSAAAAAAQRQQSRMTVLSTSIAALIGALVLFLTLGGWMRRLQRLADASELMARGDFSGSINDKHKDEIGKLAGSFDSMRVSLSERDIKLRNFTDTLQQQVKQRTHDLENALSTAEEANRAKSLFLANMSHELRTPLNGVIGMVDLLLGAKPNPQQARYCEIAKSSARSLLELINDILDFSKIEAGKLELDATDFNLHGVVESVVQMLGERAEQKGLELLCGVGTGVPKVVNGDPMRLRQVILNLMSNAIKFTETGEVVVDAVLESQTHSHAVVRFSVRDSGIGIPRHRLDRLFKSFSQVDASTTRKFGGTGLGLAISQRIAEMMGGQIGVESEEGKGATFWFTARFARRTVPLSSRREVRIDPRGLRALVVDDNMTNREILHSQLQSWSMRPDVAEDAESAMKMLIAAAEADQPYRFAILDMHMPRVDGLQLARQIKAHGAMSDIILISLSSMSSPVGPRTMTEIGFSACLSKPALPSQLYDAIVNSLSASDEPVRLPAANVEATELPGVRILLAEDNEVNRLVASELLQSVGCICAIAVNGREAVDQALAASHDVILMDCQMPEVDGFEATKMIRDAERADAASPHRTIIALTANAIKGDREKCLAAGMDGYVTKPIDPGELFRTIAQSIGPERLAQRAAEACAPVASADLCAVAADSGQATFPGAGAAASLEPAPLPKPPLGQPVAELESGNSKTMRSSAGEPPRAEVKAVRDGGDLAAAAGTLVNTAAVVEQPAGAPAVSESPIDLASLTKRCMGNRKIAAKALGKFDNSVPQDVTLLDESIRRKDAKAAAAAAHKLKGAAANLSAEGIRRISAELESLAKADAFSQAEASLSQLHAEVERFRSYVATALAELTPIGSAGATPPGGAEIRQ